MRRLIRIFGIVAAVIGAAALALAGTGYVILRGSLPELEGRIAAPGLSAPVAIERDAAGVPTLSGANRKDLAFALGFTHAQERYFQMDLLRRSAAGELSELVGAATLGFDRPRRIHRFRARAQRIVAGLDAEERRLIEAYAAGVNHGFSRLASAPFEYWLLQADATPWLPEDTILAAFAIYCDLQEAEAWTERRRGLAFETLGAPLASFLYPDGSMWDAPLDGAALPAPPIPEPKAAASRPAQSPLRQIEPEGAPGSNAWAVAGRLTESGAAMVADDMHLSLRVPNIWHRARLVAPGLDATGVTLPGTPVVLAGSNGRVAWGFTNSYVDTSDVVIVEPSAASLYATPDGPRAMERAEERICARGGGCETLIVEETIWGPVIGRDRLGRRLVHRWTAHDPDAIRLAPLFGLETAANAEEALDAARRARLPTQNIVVGDREGRIGWTLAGPVPRRFGHDGRLPSPWADGARGWSGMLEAEEIPVLRDPEEGRIWTANQRIVGGDALAKLGFGGYAHGGRATQIRDDLRARERFGERDFLAIQLDDRTPIFGRWRDLMRGHAERRRGESDMARIFDALAQPSDRAAVDSASYRLLRSFRAEIVSCIYGALTAPMRAAEKLSEWEEERLVPPEGEESAFRLLSERPPHLLPEGFATWDALIDDALDRTAALVKEKAGGDPSRFTWGAVNKAQIRHPLSQAVPALSSFLDAPSDSLPGDLYTPRVSSPKLGASERFAITPGREETALFHMPGGQAGHPLSPYYLAGHRDWLTGEPTPLRPAAKVWSLTLAPR